MNAIKAVAHREDPELSPQDGNSILTVQRLMSNITMLCAGMQPMALPMTKEVLDEAAAETAQPAPAEIGTQDTAGLRARIKELEMEQKLMQAELDSVSELAQRMDTQLR